MKPFLLRHLEGEKLGRFPAWMMRQAGRYLPRYREIRAGSSFWEMATTPRLAAEVSLLPLEVMPVDGIIFFADILTLPHGLGLDIQMKESVGPVIAKPLRTAADFKVFSGYRAEQHTPFVGEALRLIREKLPPDIALLGFAGAPWTVASYLTEGGAGKNFTAIARWMHEDPKGLTAALEPLADATVAYLKSQRDAGAHVVQLFDTWLGDMPRWFFVDHYVPLLNHMFKEIGGGNLPVIYFTKQAHQVAGDLHRLECPILSVDSLLTLPEHEARTGGKFSLQGNLDPFLLLGDEGTVRRETRKLVQAARTLKHPAILNLGHGLLPQTPVKNAVAFIEEARQLWM